nr:gliding motility-associated C-terminal domain-containing protein [uncultured Chitinophaga sp.]
MVKKLSICVNVQSVISRVVKQCCCVLLLLLAGSYVKAQQCTGSLGDPVFKETFGEAATAARPTLGPPLPAGITTYTYYAPGVGSRPTGPYPGQYTISNTTRGYNNIYFVDRPDHTTTSGRGFCMVVDANATPDKFYERTITGLCAGTTFEFSAWIMNINPSGGVAQPSLRFDIVDANNPNGPVIKSVSTGVVPFQSPGTWVRQAGIFQMPSTTSAVILRIFSNTPSSNGNDLALDDIAFAACGPPIAFAQTTGVVCAGGTGGFSVSLPAGSYSNYYFQLQKRALGTTTWANEGGVINNQGNNQYTFSVPNARAGFEYRVVAAGGMAEMNNVSCRVVSQPVELKVIDYTTAINGPATICYNTSAALTATVTPKAGTGTPSSGFAYTWETSADGVGGWTVVAGQTGATLNTGALTASRYYRVTATVSGCSGDGASSPFRVVVNPNIAVNIGTVNPVCQGTALFSIPYTVTSGNANVFGITSADMPGFSPVTNAALGGSPINVVIPTNVAPGTYHFTITFRHQASGCSASYPVTLVVSPPPTTATVGPNQQLCGTSNTTLTGNTPAAGTGMWTQVSGPGIATFDNRQAPNANVSGLVPGTYTFRWTITSGACPPSYADLQVTAYGNTTLPDAGPDSTQYNSGVFHMQANTPTVGTGKWVVISGNPVIADPTDPHTTITIPPNTSATLAWTITNQACPPLPDEVTITYVSRADIQATKEILEQGPYIAGQALVYRMVITNAGPSNATGVKITDPLPAGFAAGNVSVASTGAAQITQNNSTNTNIDVTADIPTGNAVITITVSGKIQSSFEGDLVNTVTAVSPVVPDPDGASATVTVPVIRRPYFDVVKSAPAMAIAGESIRFGIIAQNSGLGDARAAVLTDVISSKLTNVSWTATATGKVSILSGATGTGNNLRIVADYPGGDTPADTGKIYISVTGTVDAGATGSIDNVARVTPTETSVGDFTSNTTNTVISSSPGLVIDKSRTTPVIAIAGTPVQYVITLINNGPSNAVQTVITDAVPAAIQQVQWTATAQGSAAVTAGASGTGNQVRVTGNIPAGSSNIITIRVSGVISADYSGTLSNTVTATPAEPGVPPVSDTDVATVQKAVKLTIVKNGPATAVPGQQISYTIDVDNEGPSNSTATTISDVIPASLYNVTWTASETTGTATITSGATGSGNQLSVTANMAAKAAIRIVVRATILPPTYNPIHNTAVVTPSEPGFPPVTSNEVITTVNPQAALTISKTGPDTATAGSSVSYVITVGNNGPSNARDMQIKDAVPASLQQVTWTAVANGNATIDNGVTGSGNNIALSGDIAAGRGNNIVITVSGKLDPAFSGTLTNTAIVVPAETGSTGDTATKQTVVRRLPQITITKAAVDGVLAGDSVTYTIEVANAGASDAQNLVVTDVVPATLSGVRWTARVQGQAAITAGASGTGNNVRVTGNIPAGSANKLVIVITGKTDPGFSGSIINHATATPSEPVPPVTATQTVVVRKLPAIRVTKAGPTSLNAGERITYTVLITNTSVSDADNLVIEDIVPAAVTQTTWSAISNGAAVINSGGTGTGNTVRINANIPGGSTGNSISVTITGIVDPAFSGSFTNVATAQPSEVGAQPAVSGPVVTTVVQRPSLHVVKTGPSTASAGDNVRYLLTVTNTGPSNALNALIADQLPALLTNVSWNATAAGGAAILTGATGSGNSLQVTADIPVTTGTVNIVVTGTIPAATLAGTIRNVATADPKVTGLPPVPSDTVTTVISQRPRLIIQKNAPASWSAGEYIIYGVKVENAGPSDARATAITDAIPATIVNPTWTATANGTAVITSGATGTGNQLNVVADIPAGTGNSVTILIAGRVQSDFAGVISNTATATPAEPNVPPVSSNVSTNISRRARLEIHKTGPATTTAGNSIAYTLEVLNNGPSDANNITIKDAVPAGILNATWTATASGGASLTSAGTGTQDVLVNGNIPVTPGAKITVQINGKVDPDYALPNITNVAIALNDPSFATPAGDTASVVTTINRVANLRIVKSGPANQGAGEPMQYTLQVQNDGPSNVQGARIEDVLPSTLLNSAWVVTGTGGVSNITPTSGTGNVNVTADIPAGNGTLKVTVTGILSPALVNGATVTNTGTVSLPAGSTITDPNLSDNTSTVATTVDNDPVVRIAKTGPAVVNVGDTIQYRVVVTNGGSGNITGALITDQVPADVTVTSWGAAATDSAQVTGPTTGTGNNISTTANIPVGNSNMIIILINGVVNKTSNTSFTNTAVVTAGANKQSSITTTVNQSTDVSIVKSGPQQVTAGETVNYTLRVFNAGPVDVESLVITDQVPAAVTNVTWKAVVTGTGEVIGAQEIDSAGSNIIIPGKLAAGSSNYITVYISGTVSGSATSGSIANTANVAVNNVTDYNPANNTSTLTTTIGRSTGLQIRKSGPVQAQAGNTITYQVVVTNSGPSDATGVNISDVVPAQVENVSWEAGVTGAATITGPYNGTGSNVATTADIPGGAGNSVAITITGTLNDDFAGTVLNVATASSSESPAVNDQVTTTVTKQSDVQAHKSGPATITAGDKITYLITVTNNGPAFARGLTIVDSIDTRITGVTWTTSTTGNANVTSGATGSGNHLNVTADIPANDSAAVTITITGTVRPNATNTISNKATVTSPDPQTPTVVTPPVITEVVQRPELTISKSGPQQLNAGETISYWLDITNKGLSNARQAVLSDQVPASVKQVSWQVLAITPGGSVFFTPGGGNNVHATVDIPAGGGIRLMIQGKVDSTFSGTIINTAIITPAEPGNVPDSSEVQTDVFLKPSVQITKSGPATLQSGQTITYTIIAKNDGPSMATNAAIFDAVPAAVSNVSWSAVAAGNALITGPANGTGNLVSLTASIPPGATNSVTVTVNGTVDPSFRDTLNNTAIITPSETGALPDTSILVQTVVTAAPKLHIQKAGPATATAGQPLQYTLLVSNSGLSNAVNFIVTDVVPATLTQVTWKAVANGTAVIKSPASGTGNNISLTGDMPAGNGNSIVVTITGNIAANASGTIVNTATVTPAETGATPESATATTQLITESAVRISKTGPATMIRGDQASYVISVINQGPSDAVNTDVTDLVPAVLTNVTWTATPLRSTVINSGATGSGNNVKVNVNMPAADTSGLAIEIKGTVAQNAPSGSVNNTAHAVLNNMGGKAIPSNTVVSTIGSATDLVMTKTGPAEVFTGSQASYQLTISNDGPSNADNATVTDILPATLTQPSVTVLSMTGGAANVQATLNGNTMNATLGTFPTGAKVVLQVNATAGTPGSIQNTAVVNTPAGMADEDSSNNSSTASTVIRGKSKLEIVKSVSPATGPYSAGQVISYTLQISNTGSAGVNPVVVLDTLPPASLVSDPVYSNPPSGNIVYNSSTRVLQWNAGLLNAGETRSWSYDVTIRGVGNVRNIAVVTGPPDVSVPDTSIVTINTEKSANLKVVKQLTSTPPFSVNNVLTFTITATNNGPDKATGVVVQDRLQSMLGRPLTLNASAGTAIYDIAAAAITWQIPELAAGASATLTFTVKLMRADDITNTATVSGNEKDPDMSDNTSVVGPVKVTGEDIFIPNVVTPNGDGKNDNFFIPGLSKFPGSAMYIYNRWGNQVYQHKNYDNKWNGDGLSEGTYYYILELRTEQGVRKYKGWVELMR